MIMSIGLGDGKADRNAVKEGRIGRGRSDGPEIGADLEDELECSSPEVFPCHQGSIRSPVGIRDGAQNQAPFIAFESKKLDGDAPGRLAVGGIQNMGGQAAHENLE